MKSMVRIALFFSLLGLAPISAVAGGWGSIAYSPSSGRYGWNSNVYSAWNAQQFAVNNCGYWDCRVVTTVRNGCASLAVGVTGNYGTGIGYTSGRATNLAIQNCYAFGGGSCRPWAWVCAPGFF